jgi:hypothetical protein
MYQSCLNTVYRMFHAEYKVSGISLRIQRIMGIMQVTRLRKLVKLALSSSFGHLSGVDSHVEPV